MTPPIQLPPDGVAALAALIALHGQPAALAPALADRVEAIDAARPRARLAELSARRTHLGPPSPTIGRAPAARFLRRLHRRWRVAQGPPIDPARLARAGRRAARRGLGWPGATPLTLGAWLAFWADDTPAKRHDLLAMQTLEVARRIVATPILRANAQRFWP